jgi:nicotinamidase-related amidase
MGIGAQQNRFRIWAGIFTKLESQELIMRLIFPILTIALILAAKSATAANIVELWDQVKAPPAPALSAPSVKAVDTALLLLDIEQLTCNPQGRPRCAEVVPAMARFLEKARIAHLPVLYSNTGRGSRETMLAQVAPKDDEPIVKGTVNKFLGTRLDDLLKAKNIKTVIVCGTSASGAALHTATAAAQLGYQIVLPVDCVPGSSLYEEQSSVWSLLNGPGTARVTTATTLDAIRIE